jgi:rhamnosyltransferase
VEAEPIDGLTEVTGVRARSRQDAAQDVDANGRPRVLILLASCNGAPWIADQIDSILAQQGVDIRLIVRDDCSADETRARIAPFLRHSPVSLTLGDSPTGSAAQNYFNLIRDNPADDFDFIALSDQDDSWNTDKLVRACDQLRREHCAGYSSATLAVWPSGRSAVLTQSARVTGSDFLFGGIGQGCTFVLTRGFYARVRRFLAGNPDISRDIHYHDWALYALARAWGLRWIFDPIPSVRYRQHDRNDTGARASAAGVRKRLSLIRRGWFANQLRAIAALCAAADPVNAMISKWQSTLLAPDTWSRRFEMARFCWSGGRRSMRDNAVLVTAALAGWL